MFEKRSKDGKILYIVSYSYQLHRYNIHKYRHGNFMAGVGFHLLSDCLAFVEKHLQAYNTDNPTKSRYNKLITGDIYDSETETIINHTALVNLLDGLDDNDKNAISEALQLLA